MNRYAWHWLLVVASLLWFVPIRANAVVIYQDNFNDGIVAANISSINGANLTEANGQLVLTISNPGQGMSITVPTNAINCFAFEHSAIVPSSPIQAGDQLNWRWIVEDPNSGMEYTILESDWIQTAGLQGGSVFPTRKKNAAGQVVAVTQEVDSADLDMLPPDGKHLKTKWDRRVLNGVTQVQLEIVIVDPNTGRICRFVKLFPWQDPPSFVSKRFEVTANFPVAIVFESVVGEDLHSTTAVPALSTFAFVILGLVLVFFATRRILQSTSLATRAG